MGYHFYARVPMERLRDNMRLYRKVYLSILRIRIIQTTQYRAVALGAVLTRFAWGFMEILAFSALYRSGQNSLPMEFSHTVSYIWMQQALFVLFVVVFGDSEISSAIISGSIAYELIRPTDLYSRWFFQVSANRIAPAISSFLPILLLAFLVPEPFRMSLSLNIGQLLLFLLSSVLALGVVAAFAMIMHISLFYTLSHRGIKIIVSALTTFLSGGIIPLPFVPEPLLSVVRLLPFAAMQNMPLLIYSGSIVGSTAIQGIVFQMIWLAALLLSGQLFMRRALKKVIVQGG